MTKKKEPKPEVDPARQIAAAKIGLAAVDLIRLKSLEREAARITRELVALAAQEDVETGSS